MFKLTRNIISVVTFLVLGLGLSAISANAQDYEPWTGSVVGATINFGNNDSLKTIRKLINEGDTVGAVRESRKMVTSISLNERSGKKSSIQYDAFNALCLSLTSNKEYDEAMKACNSAIEHSPRRWQAINSRGSLNFKTSKYSDALADYRNALDRAPDVKSIKRIIEHNIQISEVRNSGN